MMLQEFPINWFPSEIFRAPAHIVSDGHNPHEITQSTFVVLHVLPLQALAVLCRHVTTHVVNLSQRWNQCNVSAVEGNT